MAHAARMVDETASLSIAEAREIVLDLFELDATRYWRDYLAAVAIAISSFCLVPLVSLPWSLVLFGVSALAWYRAAVFTHELAHRRKGELPGFRIVWNLTCGIPLLIPAFLYESHRDHHNGRKYGRSNDGEYIPFARRPPGVMLGFLAASCLAPLLPPYRFLILTPLGWLNPRIRRYVYEHASALQIDFDYVRRLPTAAEVRSWRLQELGCLVYVLVVLLLVLSGVIAVDRVFQWYLTLFGVVLLNSFRLLGAHRYRSSESQMTFEEQVLDSINYPDNPILSSAWAPVGLRFHALHHLFPSMPYYALGEAHARLMARLPHASPYRLTNSPGLGASLFQLWREATFSTRFAAYPGDR